MSVMCVVEGETRRNRRSLEDSHSGLFQSRANVPICLFSSSTCSRRLSSRSKSRISRTNPCKWYVILSRRFRQLDSNALSHPVGRSQAYPRVGSWSQSRRAHAECRNSILQSRCQSRIYERSSNSICRCCMSVRCSKAEQGYSDAHRLLRSPRSKLICTFPNATRPNH